MNTFDPHFVVWLRCYFLYKLRSGIQVTYSLPLITGNGHRVDQYSFSEWSWRMDHPVKLLWFDLIFCFLEAVVWFASGAVEKLMNKICYTYLYQKFWESGMNFSSFYGWESAYIPPTHLLHTDLIMFKKQQFRPQCPELRDSPRFFFLNRVITDNCLSLIRQQAIIHTNIQLSYVLAKRW